MLRIKVLGTTPPCANCRRAEVKAQKAAAQSAHCVKQGWNGDEEGNA